MRFELKSRNVEIKVIVAATCWCQNISDLICWPTDLQTTVRARLDGDRVDTLIFSVQEDVGLGVKWTAT